MVEKKNPENLSVCPDIGTEIHPQLAYLPLFSRDFFLLYLRNRFKLCLMDT